MYIWKVRGDNLACIKTRFKNIWKLKNTGTVKLFLKEEYSLFNHLSLKIYSILKIHKASCKLLHDNHLFVSKRNQFTIFFLLCFFESRGLHWIINKVNTFCVFTILFLKFSFILAEDSGI